MSSFYLCGFIPIESLMEATQAGGGGGGGGGRDFSFYRKKRKVPPLFILIDFKLAYFGSKTGDAFFVTLGNLVNFLDRRIDV